MTSYDDNSESSGDSHDWYTGANDRNPFDGSATLHDTSFDMNGHQGQLWNNAAPFQMYDVRNIHWNFMPTATPAAYGYDVSPSLQYALGAHSSSQYVPDDVSEQSTALNWDTTQPIASDLLWTSAEQSRSRHYSPPSAQEPGSQDNQMASIDGHRLLDRSEVFQLTTMGADAPTSTEPGPSEDGLVPRRQDPRFPGDEYTAKWTRGDGIERAGWCSRCSSWHRLKDSAYWYHMHYAHGISCMTGKPFDIPEFWRSTRGSIGYEALCRTCNEWIAVGRAERWRSPYFRHAYKCQAKNNPRLQQPHSRSKGGTPRKQGPKPSKTR